MEKKLKQFTFYELYWKLIKNASDREAGRFALSASRFMFDDVEFDEPQDDMEAFIIDNAEDVLRKTKEKEIAGKIPKAYNKEMQHFAFYDSYYRAMKMMKEEDCGAYVKALCGYMFDGAEPKKLKPPVSEYFEFAKLKLKLSRLRITIGRKGGKAERVLITDKEIQATSEKDDYAVTFEEFMKLHPNVKNDLYTSRKYLLDNVDWGCLDISMKKNERYKNCDSLFQLLTHYKEIIKSF